MTSFHLVAEDRIRTALTLGESHFREFKSTLEGPEGSKTPRSSRLIRRDIGETLVAFANADGGELLVGVEDDGTITGVPHDEKEIANFLDAPSTHVHPKTPLPPPLRARVLIDGKLVLYFAIEKSTRSIHLTNDGRCLQRRDRETVPVSSEQIRFERQEQISREYDRQFVDGADVSAVDLEVVRRVGKKLAPGMSVEKLLQLLDLADFTGGSLRLRRAALLLFARDVRRWHPRCEVRILRVAGTEVKTGRDYNVVKDEVTVGSVFALMSQAWEALRYHLVQTKFGPGGIFEERILYPEDACLEAVTNAIAHRDYSIEGRGIEVFVFDDRLEVRSPGALLSNVPLEELKKLKGLHQSRNPLISRVFREMGYMREMGEGLRRIYQLMKAHDLVEPDLSADLESFTITLHHRSVFTEDAQRWISAYEKFELTREEKKIVLLGREGASFSPKQVWDTLDIVDTEDYRALLEGLQLKGVLRNVITKSAAYGRARQRGVPVKDIPRFGIRPPEECEAHFGELMRSFQQVGVRDQLAPTSLNDVVARLSRENPYRIDAPPLLRALQLLKLVDAERRPSGRLRAVLESAPERPPVPLSKKSRLLEPSETEPVVTAEEEKALAEESAKKAIYVGNVSYDVTEPDLTELFGQFGHVRSVRIPVDFYTGRPRGFAFVMMERMVDAKIAKETLDGRVFRGRTMRLGWEFGR